MKTWCLKEILRKMADTIFLNRELISGFAPERPEDGHKNTFGTALICAGSEFMTGAAVMATGAALRSGAGLVKVFSEEKTLDAIRYNEPCALLTLRPDNTASLLRKAKELCTASSVLLGSGIPEDFKDLEALTGIFLENSERIVLDAGAFPGKADRLGRFKELLRNRKNPAVITPHIGEFARLTCTSKEEVIKNPEGLALAFAKENNCVTVLKGATTFIAMPDGKLFANENANSGLAKGGSGDVLAGLIAGFLAQKMEPYKAALAAVYIHSAAGSLAACDLGKRTMLPTDILVYLPEAYLEAGWEDFDE